MIANTNEGEISEVMDWRRRKAFADATAGLIGSLVALWIFYPMDVWKTRCQAKISLNTATDRSMIQKSEYNDTVNTNLAKEHRGFGGNWVYNHYKGVYLKTWHCATSSFIFFFVDSWISAWYLTKSRNRRQPSSFGKLTSVERFLLSAIAACINTAITLPLDVISSQQQALPSSDNDRPNISGASTNFGPNLFSSNDDDSIVDFVDTNSVLLDDNGEDSTKLTRHGIPTYMHPISSCYNSIISLWKGLIPSLLLCFNPSIQYTLFDRFKSSILESRDPSLQLTLSESFMLGLLAKLSATLLTYPLIRMKILLMVTDQSTTFGTLIQEFRKEGFRSMYRGCNLQLLHTILKSALLMAVREKITRTTYSLILPNLG